MDSRKIQSVGGGTFTVSLPKDWADAQGLSTGDTVDLHAHVDGILAVDPGGAGGAAPAEVTVPVDHDDPAALERTVRAAYVAGVTDLELVAATAFTDEQRRAVDRVARTLTGVSVASAAPSRIAVRTLLDSEEISVRQSVRQCKFVALSIHRDATAALSGDPAGDPIDRNGQAVRLHALLSRSLGRALARLNEVDALGVTRPALFELWNASRELEGVAADAETVDGAARRLDAGTDPDALRDARALADDARELVADAVDIVLGDASVETAREVLAECDRVREDLDALERRASATGNAELAVVAASLRRTADRGGRIARRGLQGAIRRDGFPDSGTAATEDGDRTASSQ